MSQTLLLVDDHPLFRRGVRELIYNECDFYDRVIEADNGREALILIERYAPKCVMLDIAMPEIDGLHTLDIVKRQFPDTPCIMFSMYDNPEFIIQARNRGAQGYILKTDSDSVILECLESIENGKDYISSALSHGTELRLPESKIGSEDFDRLSNREKEVLTLIAKNQTSKEIAQHLSLSLRTIQNHRVNICKKLRIAGPNALLKVAIENQAWL